MTDLEVAVEDGEEHDGERREHEVVQRLVPVVVERLACWRDGTSICLVTRHDWYPSS